jgi:hypothetical protein
VPGRARCTNHAQKQLPNFTAPKFISSVGGKYDLTRETQSALQNTFTAPKFNAVVGDALNDGAALHEPLSRGRPA